MSIHLPCCHVGNWSFILTFSTCPFCELTLQCMEPFWCRKEKIHTGIRGHIPNHNLKLLTQVMISKVQKVAHLGRQASVNKKPKRMPMSSKCTFMWLKLSIAEEKGTHILRYLRRTIFTSLQHGLHRQHVYAVTQHQSHGVRTPLIVR